MGIFSLFGKKDRREATPDDHTPVRPKRSPAGKTASPKKAGSGNSRPATKTPAVRRDAQAALATALKIDAIESEMSSEFVASAPQHRTAAPPAAAAASAVAAVPAPVPQKARPEQGRAVRLAAGAPAPAARALPALEMGTTTQFLLDGSSMLGDVAVAESEAAAVIEEAAIMYANGQAALVEQLLRSAIDEDLLGNAIEEVWLMLFDLYQVGGKQQEFEQLSIAYASRFETSPPAWIASAKQDAPQVPAGSIPAISFAGLLDSGSRKNVDRVAKLAETHRALRLDFMRVTAVDAEGCGQLLKLLQRLQKSGHELVLVGAPELAEKIRAIIEVGRRDDTDDAWLLQLEILRLLNREKEFEEASIDYCVTFEVSPPAFVSPQGKVTTAAPEPQRQPLPAEGFMMPPVVEGRIDSLIVSIATYSDEHNPAILDCSRLERVDFNAAGRLLTGLAPFCGVGRTLEFHYVNHLVAALFNTIGLKDIARIVPRKG